MVVITESTIDLSVVDTKTPAETATAFITETDNEGIQVHSESDDNNFVKIDGNGVDICKNGRVLASFSGDSLEEETNIKLEASPARYGGSATIEMNSGHSGSSEINIVTTDSSLSSVSIDTNDFEVKAKQVRLPMEDKMADTSMVILQHYIKSSNVNISELEVFQCGMTVMIKFKATPKATVSAGNSVTGILENLPNPITRAVVMGKYSQRVFLGTIDAEGNVDLQNTTSSNWGTSQAVVWSGVYITDGSTNYEELP